MNKQTTNKEISFEDYLKSHPYTNTRSFGKDEWEASMYEQWKEETEGASPSTNTEGDYTKGPWTIVKTSINSLAVAQDSDKSIIAVIAEWRGKQAFPNAKLIASAPQLKADNEALARTVEELKEQLSNVAGEANASVFHLLGKQKQILKLQEANRELIEALKIADTYMTDDVSAEFETLVGIKYPQAKHLVSAAIAKHSKQ